MEDKLRKDVEAMVMSIFSEKEEAEVRRKTEDALQQAAATIEDLTNMLEERDSEIEGLKSSSKEMESNVEDLNTKLEAAKEEIKDSKTKLDESQAALEEIKKDRIAEIRFFELEEAKVARTDEKSKEEQVSKIREMSNEEFATYKDELVDIRKAVIAEIEGNRNVVDTNTVDTNTNTVNTDTDDDNENTSDTDTASNNTADADDDIDGTTDVDDETPLANIDPNRSISAAMNVDVFPGDEVLEKYNKLGQAMAEKFKTKR